MGIGGWHRLYMGHMYISQVVMVASLAAACHIRADFPGVSCRKCSRDYGRNNLLFYDSIYLILIGASEVQMTLGKPLYSGNCRVTNILSLDKLCFHSQASEHSKGVSNSHISLKTTVKHTKKIHCFLSPLLYFSTANIPRDPFGHSN